uniref:C-type lectin domain-containing protein n=1 Tax=Acrobeloides nanus TaxID=290746 RepID=A0A914CQL9_9BILA
MFNLVSTDKNFYEDFIWTLTQVNCACGDPRNAQLTIFDTSKGRWQRYAECYLLITMEGFGSISVLDMCSDMSNESFVVPIALTSRQKYVFIEEYIMDFPDIPKYYLGLHRNKQNQWVWLDYDGSEFPLGNYTHWAPGYSANSPGQCVAAISQNGTGSNLFNNDYRWVPTSCYSENASNFCQSLACDADYKGCQSDIPPPKKLQKRRKIKSRPKKRVIHKNTLKTAQKH